MKARLHNALAPIPLLLWKILATLPEPPPIPRRCDRIELTPLHYGINFEECRMEPEMAPIPGGDRCDPRRDGAARYCNATREVARRIRPEEL